jgi:hypothetical protein
VPQRAISDDESLILRCHIRAEGNGVRKVLPPRVEPVYRSADLRANEQLGRDSVHCGKALANQTSSPQDLDTLAHRLTHRALQADGLL